MPSWLPRILAWSTLAIAVFAGLAIQFPPRHAHYAGGDAGHYANLAAQFGHQHRSGAEFYPRSVPHVERQRLDRLVTDGRGGGKGRPIDDIGLMTPFVSVGRDHGIGYPHSPLYPRLSSLVGSILGMRAAAYVNLAFYVASAALVGLILRACGARLAASLFGAAAYLALPSHLELARWPMSEPTATFLLLAMVLLGLRLPRDRKLWACAPLALLVHTREEFVVVAVIAILMLGFNGRRGLVVAGLIMASMGLELMQTDIDQSSGMMSIHNPIRMPELGALGDVLAGRPSRLGSFAAAAWLAGLFAHVAVRRRVPGGWRANSRDRLLVPVAVGAACIAVVGADLLRLRLRDGETFFGLVTPARFQTGSLLLTSVGPALLLLGVSGLAITARRLTSRLPVEVMVPLAPLATVLVNMRASPPNALWWTRRFHLLVYPLIVIGAALLIDLVIRRFSRRYTGPVVAVTLSVALAGVVIGYRGEYPDAGKVLAYDLVARFHVDAARLPVDTALVLARDSWGMKAQLPLRTFHGLWSFVHWAGDDAVPETVEILARAQLPVMVDRTLLGHALDSRDWIWVADLRVYETPVAGRTIHLYQPSGSARSATVPAPNREFPSLDTPASRSADHLGDRRVQ